MGHNTNNRTRALTSAALAGVCLLLPAGVATAATQPATTHTDSSNTAATNSSGDAQGASLTVSPRAAAPGQHVVVRLSCLGERAPVSSPALRNDDVQGAAGSVYTDATVKSTTSGTYTVSSRCADKPMSTTFTVR